VRILFVNKYLYPKGGSETHLLDLAGGLDGAGHAIDFFGMEHADNVTPPHRTTTVPLTAYGGTLGWPARMRALGGMVFSTAAHRRLKKHLHGARPDVAHLHNIYHQLSPSVLVALQQAGVPRVLTAHDYKLVCPSYSLHDGRSQCFACRGHRYWNVLTRGCSRQGLAGGMALLVEAYAHRFWRVYERLLDAIVAPSRFLRDRLVEGGVAPDRIRVLPNALAVDRYEPNPEPGDYLLYVGRLSYEKGLPTLLAAARQVPQAPLWLVGDGPLRGELEQQAGVLSHVRFLGAQPRPRVKELLRQCRALLLSSEVPENCPLSVLEAFATAKPVIASCVGGVPELFEAEATGLTVPPGDPNALAAAMRQFWEDADLCWHCGTQGRVRAEARHHLADYVRSIEAVYDCVRGGAHTSDVESNSARATRPRPSDYAPQPAGLHR
jgi:glycosyltransferase involved in cell wall biosynthesis